MVHYRHQLVWKVGPDFTQKEEHQKSALCYVTHDFSFIIYKENMSVITTAKFKMNQHQDGYFCNSLQF